MGKTALVIGYTGQDGHFLTKLLVERGYKVFGSSRDTSKINYHPKHAWKAEVTKLTIAPSDFRSVHIGLTESNPDEIYNLSGQTSVGYSFEDPNETLTSISGATQNILEVLRITGSQAKFYNAGSSEMFGETPRQGADESTKIQPKSPYGVAKAASFFQTEIYRKAYGVNSCTGILFNHESEFRSKRFVTHKIINTAKRIASGENLKLNLGRVDIQRDWGYAEEYVVAMWKMLQRSDLDDYVIASGRVNTLVDFVEEVFKQLDLDYEEYLVSDQRFFRPHDILYSRGKPIKAKRDLSWNATITFQDLVGKLIRGGHESN